MNYKVFNDYELISFIRENDGDSYDVLFQKYCPIIKKIALEYYQKFKDYGYDLDDFIQEGYLSFQRALTKYNESKDVLFYTFVVLCIHRSLISFCRTISNEQKNINGHYLLPLQDVVYSDGIDYADSYVIQKEIYSIIWDIVYDYSLYDICVFELRWNHFQFDEISTLLGISVRCCHSRYYKVLTDIRKKIVNEL